MAEAGGLEGLGRLGRTSVALLLIGASAFLIAAVFASIAHGYLAAFTFYAATELEDDVQGNETIMVTVGGATADARDAVAALYPYAAATGLAGLLVALSGVAVLAGVRACWRGPCRGVERLALFWALTAAGMFALLAASRPLYTGPPTAATLGLLGSLLIAAAAAMPSRLAKAAALLGIVGALLVGAGVYSGAYPYKAGSVDLFWLNNVTTLTEIRNGLVLAGAIIDPVWPLKDSVAPRLNDTAASLLETADLIEKGNLSDPLFLESVRGRLESDAQELLALAAWLSGPQAERAEALAARVAGLAQANPPSAQEVRAVAGEVARLSEEVSGLPPTRLNVAAHLEALALVYPGTALAGALAAASALAPGRARPLLIAVAVAVAGVAVFYASLAAFTGPAKVASLQASASEPARSLEIRALPTWRALATAIGLVRISSFLGIFAGLLIAAGAAIAAAALRQERA